MVKFCELIQRNPFHIFTPYFCKALLLFSSHVHVRIPSDFSNEVFLSKCLYSCVFWSLNDSDNSSRRLLRTDYDTTRRHKPQDLYLNIRILIFHFPLLHVPPVFIIFILFALTITNFFCLCIILPSSCSFLL